jgi:hypothetical protein
MAGLLNLVEHVADVVIPLVQSLICGLLDGPRGALLEDDDALHAVDLGLDTGALDDHVAELSLGEVHTHTRKLSKPLQPDARVILLDSSDVVLDQLSQELLEMNRSILSL